MSIQEYFEAQTLSFPEQAEVFNCLKDLHSKKLWFQLSSKLQEIIRIPFFQGQHILRLHDQFVSKIRHNLKALDYAVFAAYVAQHHSAPDTLIQEASAVVKDDTQASLYLYMEATRRLIAASKFEEVKDRLEEGKKKLESSAAIMDDRVHSIFYRGAMEFYKVKGPATQYYQNGLLFLNYTPLNSLSTQDQIGLASNIGMSSLIGENIYNFGELLQHPIFAILKDSSFEWLQELLLAFNAGDITKFQSLFNAKSASEPILVANRDFLNQKIRIMALLELVFRRGSSFSKEEKSSSVLDSKEQDSTSSGNTLTFAEVAKACQLSDQEVELMLMKAFSTKVIRGSIDQVGRTVRITYIQPRVLDVNQIKSLRERVSSWVQKTNVATQYLESNAHGLI